MNQNVSVFFEQLEHNFKAGITAIKEFNFKNFGTYFACILILGLSGVLVSMVWVQIADAMGVGNQFSNQILPFLADFPYDEKLVRAFGILGLGLFALMLAHFDNRNVISVNSLFSSISLDIWKNFGIAAALLFLAYFFVSEQGGYYFYGLDYSISDIQFFNTPNGIVDWLAGISKVAFNFLTYFLTALLVQLGSSKFTFKSGRKPHLYAGLVLLMVFTSILDRFTGLLAHQITGLIAAVTFSGSLVFFMSLIIAGGMSAITMLPKSRSLGVNLETNQTSSGKSDDFELLDDLI